MDNIPDKRILSEVLKIKTYFTKLIRFPSISCFLNCAFKDFSMKFSTFLLVIVEITIIGCINGEVNFCLELDSKYVSDYEGSLEEVSTLLEEVGKTIKNSIGESVPETVNYTDFHLNLSHPAITLEGDFSNGTTFIANQTVKLWTFKEEGLEIFNLTFPYIAINGSYNASGYVGAHHLFDIYGEGTFDLNMINFSVAALTGLNINSSALCIPLTVYVYLEDYNNNFKNFMNGDKDLEPLLNGAIQALVPEAVRIIFRESLDAADPNIQKIIDRFLHSSNSSKSLSKLLYILATHKDQLKSILNNGQIRF